MRDDEPTLRRGEVQIDLDGTRWIVTGYHSENGPYYSRVTRVREGSLAASVIFGEARERDATQA